MCIIVILILFENGAIGLCTCSADLSFCSELSGVGLNEVDACIGLDSVDT